MTDRAIDALSPIDDGLVDANVIIEAFRKGKNYKLTRAQLIALAMGGGGGSSARVIAPIVTGAAPVTLDLGDLSAEVYVFVVTSGGTGGIEQIILPSIPAPVGGYSQPRDFAKRVIVFLDTQTDPGDNVQLQIDDPKSELDLDVELNTNPTPRVTNDVVIMDYEGASAVLNWRSYAWFLDPHQRDNDSSVDGNPQYQQQPTDFNWIGRDDQVRQYLIWSKFGPGLFSTQFLPIPPVPGSESEVALTSVPAPGTIQGAAGFYQYAVTTSGSGAPETVLVPHNPGTNMFGGRIFFSQPNLTAAGDAVVIKPDLVWGQKIIAADGSAVDTITLSETTHWVELEQTESRDGFHAQIWRIVDSSYGVAIAGPGTQISAHTGTAAPTLRGTDVAFEITYGAGSTTDITITFSNPQRLVPIPQFATSLGGITPSVLELDAAHIKIGNLGALGGGKLFVTLTQPAF